ncbi:MAG: hypothetical protein ACJ72N_19890 [Labedaea sp.]
MTTAPNPETSGQAETSIRCPFGASTAKTLAFPAHSPSADAGETRPATPNIASMAGSKDRSTDGSRRNNLRFAASRPAAEPT